MKPIFCPKVCSTGRVGNEERNGKFRKSQSVTARARLRAEAARAAHCSQGSKSHVQRSTAPLKRDYPCHCNHIFILSSYSDSKKKNYVVSCYPLKMHILITEIQLFHHNSPSQRNIRHPSADY